MKNVENQKPQHYRDGCSVPISVFFGFVLAWALCGLAIAEYQRSIMRYKMEKIKYERFMDSVQKHDSEMRVLSQTNGGIKTR